MVVAMNSNEHIVHLNVLGLRDLTELILVLEFSYLFVVFNAKSAKIFLINSCIFFGRKGVSLSKGDEAINCVTFSLLF